MCRPTCPFAAALFGTISGSASGGVVGAVSGWLLHAAYLGSGGDDPQGLAFLVFGTLGTGIGGSGGAVGGMVEGWGLAEGKGSSEAHSARWGAILGVLWGLQPILWLASKGDTGRMWWYGLEITLVVIVLGVIAGLLGGQTARLVVRTSGLVRPATSLPGKR
jgi:hypothetical protein